jgi:hypothetical protein
MIAASNRSFSHGQHLHIPRLTPGARAESARSRLLLWIAVAFMTGLCLGLSVAALR